MTAAAKSAPSSTQAPSPSQTSPVRSSQPLKLTQIGNSVGVVLPKDMLARLNLAKGDTLFVTESPEGIALRTYDPAFAEQMDAARALMKKRRAALRELAK